MSSLLFFYYISFGANILALLLMIVLLVLPKDRWIKSRTEKNLFFALIINAGLAALLGVLSYSTVVLSKALGVRDICFIGMVIGLYQFVFQWLLYVDYRLYRSRDQLFRRYKYLYIPLLIFVLGRICAEYAGSMIPLPLDIIFQVDLLFYIDDIFGFLFLVFSAILAIQYKSQKGHWALFSILPGVIPMLVGYIVNWFTGWSVVALADALGVVLVGIAMVWQERYYDSPGLYSKEYLRKLLKNTSPRINSIWGVVIFEPSKEVDNFSRLLRAETETEDLIVDAGDNVFALLSQSGRPEDLNYMGDMILSAAEEAIPGITLNITCITRKTGEASEAFIKNTVLDR